MGEAEDGLAALDLLRQTEVDVVLSDIRMPRMDGLQLALQLQKWQRPPAIIFTTAFDDYAVKAFELTATDYLLKPVRAERLLAALRKVPPPRAGAMDADVLRILAPGGRTHLCASERGRLILIPVQDILYLRADAKYVSARTRHGEHLLDETLNKLEDEFGDRFLRTHRNCLVARCAIKGCLREASDGGADGRWWLLIEGVDEKIPVSRRQWPTIKSLVTQR
ncbi:LytTR family DNA-binding domain-containing protein [Denitratisoma sp. agr-D3]